MATKIDGLFDRPDGPAAFLFLVGLYESWVIPVPVLLSVPVGVLGRLSGY
jgi:hypothetical protein